MNLVIRELRISDIEDFVYWFTVDREWEEWDAPWANEEMDPQTIRLCFLKKVLEQRKLEKKTFMQIELDGRHIGWVNSYYLYNDESMMAIGITIPPRDVRGKGIGKEVLRQFIKYVRQYYDGEIYCETWSGNKTMMAVAQKMGFEEWQRKKHFREVKGRLYDDVVYKLA